MTEISYKSECWENHPLIKLYEKVGWCENRMNMIDWVMDINPATVAEIGCLDGCYIRKLRELGFGGDYTGTDYTLSYLDLAMTRTPTEKFQREDVRELSFDDNQFDMVMFSDVIQHLAEPAQPLTEVFRSASKYVLLSTYGSEEETFTRHNAEFLNTFYSKKDIMDLIPSNWDVTEFKKFVHPTNSAFLIFHYRIENNEV